MKHASQIRQKEVDQIGKTFEYPDEPNAQLKCTEKFLEDMYRRGWELLAVTGGRDGCTYVFKTRGGRTDPLTNQSCPVLLRQDMEKLLHYSTSRLQLTWEDYQEMDAITKRWELEDL